MRKTGRFILFFLFIFLLLPGSAGADSVDSIAIEAELQPNGDLRVKQTWQAEPTGGSEFYIPIQHLNHMSIQDFRVSDEEGPYEFIEDWDINASLEEKARKYGINETGNGLELCWGKSSLQAHTYTVEFTYAKALIAFNDYDAFNIRLVNDQMDPAPDQVTATISAPDVHFSTENARIWAFGYPGTVNFEQGKIVARSEGGFTGSDYLNLMLAVDKGIFQPAYSEDANFEEGMKEEALAGASWDGWTQEDLNEENDEYPHEDRLWNIFWPILFPFIVMLTSILWRLNTRSIQNYKQVDKKHPQYWRDPPFDGYIPALAFVYQYKESDILSNYISAQLLDLIRRDHIEIEQVKNVKGLNRIFNTRDTFLVVHEPLHGEWDYEESLIHWLHRANDRYGQEGKIKDKNFRKILDKDDGFPEDYADEMENFGRQYLLDHAYAERIKGKRIALTEKGLEEAAKLFAYGRFMDDFTLLNEREPYEVALWDELLVMATLLGRGEEIYKAFKEIYPDYSFRTDSGAFFNYYYLTSFSRSSYVASLQAAGRAMSGGGGVASIGGGGGFSGGGSGGGGR